MTWICICDCCGARGQALSFHTDTAAALCPKCHADPPAKFVAARRHQLLLMRQSRGLVREMREYYRRNREAAKAHRNETQ